MNRRMLSRKENPQKLTQLSSISHPRHLVGKRTAQKDIIDITSDSQVNSNSNFEFARTKEQLFDRWCSSKKIGSDYPKLRQLMQVEEFKRCINSDVKLKLWKKLLV